VRTSLSIALVAVMALLLGPLPAAAQNQEGSPGARQHRQVFCAREGGYCRFNGIATVRYGARGRYADRPAVDGIACSSGIFGDPYPGVRKSCFFLVLGVGY
jgi:hypothetical protein